MTRRAIGVLAALALAVLVAFGVREAMRRSAAAPAAVPAATPPTQSSARGPVTIDPRRQQLVGVRTAPVRRIILRPELRVPGTIVFDETRQADVNVKVDGWIRELFVDYTGRAIRQGDPLFTLYSPDVLATQNELLLARRGRDQLAATAMHEYSDRLVAAARQRLELWDVGAREIEALEASAQATGIITVRSPASGFIAEKTAVRGMRVMAGQSLYRIADTSVVWVEASVPEHDLGVVAVGQSATVTLPANPGAAVAGRAIYVHPTVDEQTRTGRVRFQLANRQGRLKPGMFVDVELNVTADRVLAVPADALLDSGTEQVVFVAEGNGYFSPRRVRAGRRAGGDVEIREGLREGEEVATSATFFLDSESQLRAGLQNYEATQPAASGSPAPSAAVNVTFTSDPDPPRTGESAFQVTVTDAAAQPIADAEVSIVLFMPAMPAMNMPAMRTETKLSPVGRGVYRGAGQVLMGGRWDVTVTVRRGGQTIASRQFAVVAR